MRGISISISLIKVNTPIETDRTPIIFRVFFSSILLVTNAPKGVATIPEIIIIKLIWTVITKLIPIY